MDLAAKVRENLRAEKLLDGAEVVICALSGGADSVCLAHLLKRLAPEFGCRVECAHYHHGIRGAEADRDARFVEAWCREQGLPLHSGFGDVPAHAAANGLSMETAARELRYDFLESLGDERSRIATAHQAEDQLETVLLHLIRGSGLNGLGGIAPRRGRLIRPLLNVTRREILDYLTEQGIPHVEDSTNAVPDTARNLLRLEVLPVLERLNPSAASCAVRTAAQLRSDEAVLRESAAALISGDEDEVILQTEALLAAPAPVAARAVLLAAGRFHVIPEEKHIRAVLALAENRRPSAEISLPGGLTAARCYGELRLFRTEEKGDPEPVFPEFGQWTPYDGGAWQVFWGKPGGAGKIHGKFTSCFFKTDRICGRICVRPRRPGDGFRPLGAAGTVSLKKRMIDRKIPRGERGRIPVAADDTGVLAIPDCAPAARAAVPETEADAVLIFSKRT